MTFDWHMLYALHTVILDNSQVFGGVPCKAQLCNFSKWFFSPRFGVVPIWELWQFCYVRIEPPKTIAHTGIVIAFACHPSTMLLVCGQNTDTFAQARYPQDETHPKDNAFPKSS